MIKKKSTNLTRIKRTATSMTFALICLTTLLVGSGCAHVTPQTPTPKVASFSGNTQNSGIVSALPGGGWEITESARQRYNSFARLYGKQMMPPVSEDFGVEKMSNGNYSLTFEAAAKWRRMILLHHRELQREASSLATKIGL